MAKTLRLSPRSVLTLALAVATNVWAEPQRVAPEEARTLALSGELVLVDVRSPVDFVAGHIQGARNVPSSSVDTAGLPRQSKILVYCGEDPCALTTGAAERLMASGYRWVRILDGGLPSWIAKGYPLDKGGLELPKVKVPQVSAADAEKRLGAGAVALDVRPPEEFAAGHLPGARSVPLESLESELARLPREADFVVYDRVPARSKEAAEKLIAAGRHVAELSGGVAGWVRRRLPLEVK